MKRIERAARPHVHLVTLGCAKNLVDSERILARLAAAGAIVGAPAEEADIIIVNTCGFIRPAQEESVETILELARLKEHGRCRKLIVMGCLSQRYPSDLAKSLPEADGVFGLHKESEIVAACGLSATRSDSGRLLLTPRHTAYLRIADGCDNRCAYCVIPDIRGPFRSRPAGEIIEEAEALTASGARELVLIGQDTTLYGTDISGGLRIHELLARLNDVKGVRWLRLLYTHPAHFTEELIEAYAALPKVCPYVDLPVQHLSDTILRRMGRKVSRKTILELIERLRRRVAEVAIRTTLLVGFPGETRAHLNEMLSLVKTVRFDHLGVFAYSREQGTRAARMRGQVSEQAKSRRLRDLMLAQQEIVFERNRTMKRRTVEVVIDARTADSAHIWIARSRGQAPDVDSVTYVKGKNLRPGRFLKVRITGSRGYDLLARPLTRKAVTRRT